MAAVQDLTPIRQYYDETWPDYRLLWLSPSNYAIHFGYWGERTHSHADALNQLNAELASRIGISRGVRILDAGCGVGGSAIWLARQLGVDVVGITPVASQVERARHFATEHHVSRQAQFLQQDYTGTSFPAASFDVVWAMESLCHAADKRAFYEEARRVLRPGGRLGIVEYMRTTRPLAGRGEALLHSWLSGWAIPDIATAEEHRQWAAASGLGNVELTDITPQVRRSLARLHRMASLAWPEAVLLQTIGLRNTTQHGNVRGARDQFRALERGLWFDAILTATAMD
ncbi:MAG TPA: methyltransferase domain-containing protein [Candidatus Dormibacteraeota bacterium]|nr:methyltransferase domain-containing protein [Candidatus Dormibacteraeota bacterium]